jgi:hypothetical protein
VVSHRTTPLWQAQQFLKQFLKGALRRAPHVSEEWEGIQRPMLLSTVECGLRLALIALKFPFHCSAWLPSARTKHLKTLMYPTICIDGIELVLEKLLQKLRELSAIQRETDE